MKNIATTSIASLALCLALGSAVAQSTTPAAGGATATPPATTPAAPAAQAGAGTRNTPANAKTARLDSGDRKFIITAAEDGMYELEMAKLAASKASSAEVKSFAEMMVADHTRTNGELTQLANAKGVELPVAPKRSHRRDIEKVARMTGDKFDRTFAKEIGIDAHQKDIKLFERHSKDAKDAELKAWVDKTLPGLRAHLGAAAKLPQNARGKS